MSRFVMARNALCSCAAAALLACCSKGDISSSEQHPTSNPTSLLIVESTPGTWPVFPTYDAVDYDKPGLHPLLTPEQVARIRAVLIKVKSCQRQLVQYSFGNGFRDLVIFFAVPSGEGSHVFGTADEIYIPRDGSEIPMSQNPNYEQMEKQGIQWDIDHEPCAPAPR